MHKILIRIGGCYQELSATGVTVNVSTLLLIPDARSLVVVLPSRARPFWKGFQSQSVQVGNRETVLMPRKELSDWFPGQGIEYWNCQG